ncbi:PREDICTED: arylacetamide deacetylase-like 4 [Nanorana parkeri]|uniref:arylacetamide deacetylase-like 4 n=1 Tax=Nanorana parkeri TaxID=125878 RepID=UPI000854791D|nr:PREDICTED: arylacetamide deacetylase-like 4 [Nanorana parkeri]
MLLLVIGISLLLCILLFLGTTYLESSKAEYPPGIANPAELRRIHIVSTGLTILGKTLERFGICREITLFRFMVQLGKRRLENDPELSMKNLTFEGVPVRLYQPRLPSAGDRKGVVFIHGGGFVFGSIESYDSFCRHMSKKSGAVVVSVGYRLAPEHRYPAAFDDSLNATIHFLKTAKHYGVNPSSVVICGDSAGGNLAAGISQVLVARTDIPKPLAVALIYPSVQMIEYNLPAYQQNGMVPLLLRERSQFYRLTYLGGDLSMSEGLVNGVHVPPELRKKFSKWLDAGNIPDGFKVRGFKPHEISDFNNEIYQRLKHAFDPACSPLLAEDAVISLLPKTYIVTCEYDAIRDDGILYKKRLEDNGIPVTWYHVKDGFHGMVSFFDQPAFESGKQAMDNFVNFVKEA